MVTVGFLSGVLAHWAASGNGDERQQPAADVPAPASEASSNTPLLDLIDPPSDDVRPELQVGPDDSAADLIDRALAIEDPSLRSELLRRAVDVLRPEQVQDGLALADRIPVGLDRNRFIRELFARLAEQDPEAAITQAQQLAPGRNRRDALGQVVRMWREHDPDAAMRWVLDQPNSALRTQVLRDVFYDLSAEDPQRALRLAEQAGPLASIQGTEIIFEHWAATDPGAAAARAEELPPGAMRLDAIDSIARSWAERDPESAIAWARSLSTPEEVRRALSGAMMTHSYQHPEAAFRTAIGVEEIESYAIDSLAGSWARTDARGALSFIETLPPSRRRDVALRSVALELSFEEPMEALRVASLLPDGHDRAGIIEGVAMELASVDPRSAATWAAGLSEERDRGRAISRVVESWAENDPTAAADFVAHLPEGDEREAAQADLATQWARRDPMAASRWVVAHGAAPDAVIEVAREWSSIDMESTIAWARSLPAGRYRDAALSAVSAGYSLDDPARAWRWAMDIQDQQVRDEQLEFVARDWLYSNEQEARRWIEESDLSVFARARLLGDDEIAGDLCPCDAGHADGYEPEQPQEEGDEVVEYDEPAEDDPGYGG
jgi:hypothetical protein